MSESPKPSCNDVGTYLPTQDTAQPASDRSSGRGWKMLTWDTNALMKLYNLRLDPITSA